VSVGRLVKMINSNYDTVSPWVMEQARELGEDISYAIQNYHELGDVEIKNPKTKRLFDQYLSFLKKTKVKVLETEKLLVDDKHLVYGYSDLIVKNNENTVAIVEVKSRNTKNKKPNLADLINAQLYGSISTTSFEEGTKVET
jgi:hypothetical protein